MNKCWTSKIKTHLILLSGFQIILNHLSVIFHQKVLKWLWHSLVTLLLSKKCSKELLSNSLLCLEERLSCTGTQEKVWMKWSLLKLNPTWMISFLNISNTKTPLLKKKKNTMKMKVVQDFDYYKNSYILTFFHFSHFLFV